MIELDIRMILQYGRGGLAVSNKRFLLRLRAVASMRIDGLQTDNSSQFTGCFTNKAKHLHGRTCSTANAYWLGLSTAWSNHGICKPCGSRAFQRAHQRRAGGHPIPL